MDISANALTLIFLDARDASVAAYEEECKRMIMTPSGYNLDQMDVLIHTFSAGVAAGVAQWLQYTVAQHCVEPQYRKKYDSGNALLAALEDGAARAQDDTAVADAIVETQRASDDDTSDFSQDMQDAYNAGATAVLKRLLFA
jgi:hypothetical protein